jgi:hypothetical protein
MTGRYIRCEAGSKSFEIEYPLSYVTNGQFKFGGDVVIKVRTLILSVVILLCVAGRQRIVRGAGILQFACPG